MKLLSPVVFVLAFVFAVSAQTPTIEAEFEKNKAKYKREHFAEGEDASSGFDYVYYTHAGKVVKLRSIWSSTHKKEIEIDDFYFNDGQLVLLRRMTASKRHLGVLKLGRKAAVKVFEDLELADSKLKRWVDGGVEKKPGDPKWTETEKMVVEDAQSRLESYKDFKEQ